MFEQGVKRLLQEESRDDIANPVNVVPRRGASSARHRAREGYGERQYQSKRQDTPA